jgi:predicted nuclease with TOPRIM domain
MADEGPESLTLRLLRKVDAGLDELREDVREVKGRLGNIEAAVALLSGRMDRFDERLARIERRLELREPADA